MLGILWALLERTAQAMEEVDAHLAEECELAAPADD